MFTILKKDKRTNARIGLLQTKHGVVETPSYVIVGTRAKVKTLEPADIVASKTQMIISNTYHLWRDLGDDLPAFEGLHARLGWNGTIMTDSGGYQVFSLGAKRKYGDGKVINDEGDTMQETGDRGIVEITEDGAYFNDNGETCFLGAEKSIAIQEKLSADIIFAFDECTARHHDPEYTRASMERTHRWAKRCLAARSRDDQMLYGIVQGGPFKDLREESSNFIGQLPFEGLAIGGHLGTKQKMREVVEWCVPYLPDDKPRHLLGVGEVDDLFDFVERGMDTFDCIMPTHYARNGIIWTPDGRIDIKRGVYAKDDTPLDIACQCPVCSASNNTKADLYWTFRKIPILDGKRVLRYEKNLEGGYRATVHNVYFFNHLMGQIRDAIKNDRFLEFKKEFLTRFYRS